MKKDYAYTGSLPIVFAATSIALGCSAATKDDDDHAREWNRVHEQGVDAPCSGVTPPDGGGFGKRVALTFDDGPNAATTGIVLDVLAAHGARAAFFINGSRVASKQERDLVARARASGHLVGNHTQTHAEMTALSRAEAQGEVDATDAVLRAAGIAPAWFRFPYGSSSCETAEMVRSRGYRITGWHVDSADWCFAAGGGYCSPSTFAYVTDAYRGDMVGYTLAQIRERQGGIVLFHDVHANTAANLDGILRALEAEGYLFVGLDDASTFPALNGATPAAKPSACGDLGYAGYCGGTTVYWCEDGAIRQKDCAAAGQKCAWESDAVGFNCVD